MVKVYLEDPTVGLNQDQDYPSGFLIVDLLYVAPPKPYSDY